MNEDQYYNPIVQTYLKARGMQQEAQQNAQALAQRQAEESNRQKNETELLKQGQQRIDQEHELHKAEAEVSKGHLDIANRMAAMQAAEHMRNAVAGGVSPESAASLLGGSFNPGTPSPVIPSQSDNVSGVPIPATNVPGPALAPSTVRIPGIQGDINVSGLPGPAQILQQKLAEAKGISGATAEGKLPSEMALESQKNLNQKEIKTQEEAFQNSQLDKTLKAKIGMDQYDRQTQLQIRHLANAAELGVANIAHGVTPEQLQSGVIAGLTGQRKFNSDNIFDRNVTGAIQAAGGRQVDPQDIKALQQAQSLGPMFQQVEDFANKYLPSEAEHGAIGAKLKAYAQGGIAGTAFPTDIKNKINEIKTQAINTGKVIEGMTGGRVTNTQLGIALDGITSPGITREQALDRIENLKNLYLNKENNVILGGLPEFQQKLIDKTYGIKPAWLLTAPKKNASGHVLDEGKSTELGQPVYK